MSIVQDKRYHQKFLNTGLPARQLSAAQRSNFWSVTAQGYALWRARSLAFLTGTAFSLNREQHLFLSQCQPSPQQLWLDVGTSTGFYAGVLAGQHCKVLAADISPAMLKVAAQKEPSPYIDWRLLNLEKSGLASATFDGITVGATLNETYDPAGMLSELARLLKSGGQLWLMYVPKTGGLGQKVLGLPFAGLSFFDPAWIDQQLPNMQRASGFRVGLVQFECYLKI